MPPLTPSPRPHRLPWMSFVTGAIGLLLLSLVMVYIIYALAHEYPQPGDSIIHFGWTMFPLALIVSIVALVLGIVAQRRRDTPRWAATVGIVTGSLTFVAVSLIVWFFIYHA